ncbi:DNRLRE domain-containing protein, partial [bacterium]|nr:DNRLRE domain-containing protein [bacterium]
GIGVSLVDFNVAAPPSQLVFNPTHDSFVRSTEPNKNYGDDDELRVRLSSTDYDTYLKFNVSGITGSVVSAKIRLFVINASSQGGDLYLVSNNYQSTSTPWEEMGLVWNNAPTISGTPLSSIGAVAIGDTAEFDVTSAISGDGVYSFAMTNDISDAAKYDPKEGSVAPRLEIELLSSTLPSIASFSPASAPVGTEITISGSNLIGTTEVRFNGTVANFTVDSSTQVRADVSAGSTSGKISLVTPDGTAQSSNDFTVIHQPSVSSFTPTTGSIGTEVTISGSGFIGTTDVLFNGISASAFSLDSDAQIRATVPNGAATGLVSVVNVAETGSSGSDFTVTSGPSISSFSPALGPIGTEVTISGINFSGVTDVTFESVSATVFTLDSDTQIRVEVPVAATTGKISVTNQDGSGQSSDDFVVVEAPTIVSFTPISGPIGTEVTVTGSNFTGVTSVSFNGSPVSVLAVDSESQLRATAPTGATSGPINVVNAAGSTTSTDEFTVDEPSSLTFNPTDDTFVRSSKPNNNYANDNELRIRKTSSSSVVSYLKFNVVGMTGSVASASIRLSVFDASVDGGGIYSVSNNYSGTSNPWQEDGLLWGNAPEVAGSPLSAITAVNLGEIIEFDVTSAISGDGTYSFAIKNNSSDIVKYRSNQGTIAPELVIEFGSGPLAKMNGADAADLESGVDSSQRLTLPHTLVLSGNYPNPFNIETTIEYTVPEDGKVHLAIYNVRGQEVRNLVDQYQTAGLKKIRWDGRNKSNYEVGTGAYLVRLKFGDKSLTRIITLQK